MLKGGGTLGSHKHGISGHATKSPRLRMAMQLEAEKNERKAKKPLPFQNVKQLFGEYK